MAHSGGAGEGVGRKARVEEGEGTSVGVLVGSKVGSAPGVGTPGGLHPTTSNALTRSATETLCLPMGGTLYSYNSLREELAPTFGTGSGGQVADTLQKRFSLLPGVEEEGERKEEKDSQPQTSL
jgi:hypothetical protein